MKLKMKRAASIILLLSLLALLSCQNPGNDDYNNVTQPVDPNQPLPEEQTAQLEFTPADGADYGGYKFRILGWGATSSDIWRIMHYSEIAAETENADPINDSVYKRNREIEALYNIEIDIYPVIYPDTDFGGKFTKAVQAQDDLFDAAFIAGFAGPQVFPRNMTVDLLSLPSLDLSKSWWDQNSVKTLSFGGKLQAVIGDMNFYANASAYVVYANNQLAKEYGVENLYQLVRDGKWTWDKLSEIAKKTTKDLNSDGIMDKSDQFGLNISNGVLKYSITSAGELLFKKDADDIYEFAPDNERIASIIDKVLPLFTDKNVTVNVDLIGGGYNNVYFEYMMPKFRNNENMFLILQLLAAFELNSMEADFSILPFPKYDENQEKYGTEIQNWWITYTTIPITCTDTERTGNILQAMGYYSQKYVMPAYYQTTIVHKLIRDEDTEEMLDIIFSNKFIDVSDLYNFGFINGEYISMLTKGSNTFISACEKNEGKINTAIQKLVDEFQGN
ncbi:MAG: extracellular solute-binding protein [Oscillospiraceae bacterium]|nr:extracellular solute-binding protein [Oscillospiraceae bacterium]